MFRNGNGFGFGFGPNNGNQSNSNSNQSSYYPVIRKIDDYRVTLNDYTVVVDASSKNISIFLPDAVSAYGYIFNIKKCDSTSNIVTIIPSGTDTIDESSSFNIQIQYQNLTIQGFGEDWLCL